MPSRLLVLNVLLGALGLGAAAFIAREVATPPKPVPLRTRAASEASPPPPAAEKPAPAPPGAYSVVASRNLFSPTRNEAPVATGPSGRQAAAALPKPTLHGIVLREGTPVAYLEDPTTKRTAGYRLGDSVAGGTVNAINADHVVLNRPDGTVDVRLRDPAKPRPALPPPGREARERGTPQVPNPALQPGVPGQSVQPGQVPVPPRRMLPPNVLRRVQPPASDATE